MKEKVVVIRKWKDPSIKAFITTEDVGAEMSIEDYLVSLVEQITYLPITFTKTTLLSKLVEASGNVTTEMKKTTRLL